MRTDDVLKDIEPSLDEYQWCVDSHGYIRCYKGTIPLCPVTFAAYRRSPQGDVVIHSVYRWDRAADDINLPESEGDQLVATADMSPGYNRALRKRLLKVCGLTETQEQMVVM
jgi:hypothetical protein